MGPFQDTGNDWEEFYTPDPEFNREENEVPEFTHIERPLTDIMRQLIQQNRY